MKLFLSYDHADSQYLKDIKSVRLNHNQALNINDSSLGNANYNNEGHINRMPPLNIDSKSICNDIEQILMDSDKFILLLGNTTHTCPWVIWEYETFKQLKGSQNIFVMKTSNNAQDELPFHFDKENQIHYWDLGALYRWLKN